MPHRRYARSSVCDEAIRRWRKIGDNLALLDLRRAYLQLRVDPSLWKHQIVQYEGKYYYLTRLGFGLSSEPRIMDKILKAVLELDETIARATDNYLDDIIVNEQVVSAETVRLHLQRYGLVSKHPVLLQDGAKALGLAVDRSSDGELVGGVLLQSPCLRWLVMF